MGPILKKYNQRCEITYEIYLKLLTSCPIGVKKVSMKETKTKKKREIENLGKVPMQCAFGLNQLIWVLQQYKTTLYSLRS